MQYRQLGARPRRPFQLIRTLICLAMVKKACSTLVAVFAEVSKNGIPRLSANSCGASRRLAPWEKSGQAQYLCHCVLDDFLVRHIALVSNEKLVDAFCRIAIDLLQPLLDVVEGI